VTRALLLLVLTATAWAAEPEPPPKETPPKAPTPAEAFLRAIRSSAAASSDRHAAWRALNDSGESPITRSIVAAIDKERARGWSALDRLVASSPVRKAALDLKTKTAPLRAPALTVIRGSGFSKSKLDEVMTPVHDALEAAMAALAEQPKYETIHTFIFDLEDFAGHTPLRLGWDEELGKELLRLRLLGRWAGSTADRAALERNRQFGQWIEPAEHACVARNNVHRILLGLGVLEIDLRLTIAGKKHSEEMVALKYFSHTSPTPHLAGFGTRARREGTGAGGECIAAGNGSGVGVWRMWYYSQGHHTIMIGGGSAIGVGRKNNSWTLMVGGSRMAGAKAANMAQYVRERYRAGEDTKALFALAKWCGSVRLITQAGDELERVVALDPDNAEAKRILDRIRGN